MRHDMLARVLAAVSFFSFIAVHPASAIEASAVYPPVSAMEGVRLTEASEARPAFEIVWRDESGLRLSPMHLSPGFDRDRPRTVELTFAAPHTSTGLGLDVEFAPRTRIGTNREGDIQYAGAGAEVRLG